jgi:hypothetical protein
MLWHFIDLKINKSPIWVKKYGFNWLEILMNDG